LCFVQSAEAASITEYNVPTPNSGGASADIAINAYQSDGMTPVGTSREPLQLAGNGYKTAFADSFIAGLPSEFGGVLDISSTTPFAALTLRSLNNQRMVIESRLCR
jgi:hypothetical protein